ncbi:unnamed protein product [Calicophoron daubneyi]
MAMGILNSISRLNRFVPSDVIKEFTTAYFTDGDGRFYGRSVQALFQQWKDSGYDDPYRLAASQFGGSGSYANGGAMRISPASLYMLNQPDSDFVTFVIDVTRLTHTHPLAIYGALFQAMAVRQLWSVLTTEGQIDRTSFADLLVSKLGHIKHSEIDFNSSSCQEVFEKYKSKFECVNSLLQLDRDPPATEVVERLGNDLQALNSVPTAIYIFLRSLKPIPSIPFDSVLLRCLACAISLGGDTDTIGTMACSLAGGYAILSDEPDPLPATMVSRCEQRERIEEYARWLTCTLSQ